MFEFSLFKPTFGLDFGFFAKQALSWVELELFIKLRHQPTANRYHGFKEPVVAAKPAITFLWSNLGTDQPKHKISICYSPLPIILLNNPNFFWSKGSQPTYFLFLHASNSKAVPLSCSSTTSPVISNTINQIPNDHPTLQRYICFQHANKAALELSQRNKVMPKLSLKSLSSLALSPPLSFSAYNPIIAQILFDQSFAVYFNLCNLMIKACSKFHNFQRIHSSFQPNAC